MAHKVKVPKGKEFQFRTATAAVASKYPWDEWFDGSLWLIERSVVEVDANGEVVNVVEKKDYEVDTNAMPAKLKTAARKRYKVVQVSRVDVEGNKIKDGLIFRARDMTDEERQAEDLLRVEEREVARTKRAAKGRAEAASAGAPAAPVEG